MGKVHQSRSASETGAPVDRLIERMRRLSHFLDESFRIPGTDIRFGWDPLIGLLPGLGDLLTGLLPIFILFQAHRLRVPRIIKARMVLNVLIDVVVGAIPFVGDVFDFAWKSNMLNLALLEKHAGLGARPGLGDWAFVAGAVLVILLILALPVLFLILLFREAQSFGWPQIWSF